MGTIEFFDRTTGTSLPKSYILAIIRGMRRAFKKGKLAGQEASAMQVFIHGGDHHSVDSSDKAFETCGEFAVEQVFDRGSWSLLEPLMKVSIETPGHSIGEIIKIMSNRHGSLVESNFEESQEFGQMNVASMIFEAPLNFMFNFTSELRMRTQGKGEFTMEFYRFVPAFSETHQEAIENYMEKEGLSL